MCLDDLYHKNHLFHPVLLAALCGNENGCASTARVRDTGGALSPARLIVIRVSP
jgi:hypothetical protein